MTKGPRPRHRRSDAPGVTNRPKQRSVRKSINPPGTKPPRTKRGSSAGRIGGKRGGPKRSSW